MLQRKVRFQRRNLPVSRRPMRKYTHVVYSGEISDGNSSVLQPWVILTLVSQKSQKVKTAQTGVCLKNWPGLAHAQAVSNRQKNPNLKQMLVVSEDSTFAIPGSYKKNYFLMKIKIKRKSFCGMLTLKKHNRKAEATAKD